jgi:hypothetical protein
MHNSGDRVLDNLSGGFYLILNLLKYITSRRTDSISKRIGGITKCLNHISENMTDLVGCVAKGVSEQTRSANWNSSNPDLQPNSDFYTGSGFLPVVYSECIMMQNCSRRRRIVYLCRRWRIAG